MTDQGMTDDDLQHYERLIDQRDTLEAASALLAEVRRLRAIKRQLVEVLTPDPVDPKMFDEDSSLRFDAILRARSRLMLKNVQDILGVTNHDPCPSWYKQDIKDAEVRGATQALLGLAALIREEGDFSRYDGHLTFDTLARYANEDVAIELCERARKNDPR